MKTKEIEVWVSEFTAKCNIPIGSTTCFTIEPDKEQGYTFKAKLIIETPEKKVTITESDIDKAFKTAGQNFISSFYFKEALKKELGFKDE